MATTVEQLAEQAMTLSTEARGRLVDLLVESLDAEEEVTRRGTARVLRSDDRDVAAISPVPSTGSKTGRRKRVRRGDALQGIIGLADAAEFPDVPADVSTNKHQYLADAYDTHQ